MKHYLLFLIFFTFSLNFNAQTVIEFQKASFEGEASRGFMQEKYYSNLEPWISCGSSFANGSPPDILCADEKFWGITQDASEGNCYLNLVTRADNTYEGITQKLSQSLKKNTCYSFTVDVAHSNELKSGVKGSPKQFLFDCPTKLIITGGSYGGDTKETLFESKPIGHDDWRTIKVNFKAQSDMSYISLFSFFQKNHSPQYGNILIDNITPITECACK